MTMIVCPPDGVIHVWNLGLRIGSGRRSVVLDPVSLRRRRLRRGAQRVLWPVFPVAAMWWGCLRAVSVLFLDIKLATAFVEVIGFALAFAVRFFGGIGLQVGANSIGG